MDASEVDPSDDIRGGFVRDLGVPLSCGYGAVAEATNGHVYAIPARAGRVIEIDPLSGMVQPIGEPLIDDASADCVHHVLYRSLVLAENGRLYAPPFHASKVLEIDPQTLNVREVGFHVRPGQSDQRLCGQYFGITAAQDGHLYCPPYGASRALKLDPQTGWTSYIGSIIRSDDDAERYEMFVCANNGNLYASPIHHGLHFLELNPSAGTVRKIEPSVTGDVGRQQFLGKLTAASNGNLYAVGVTCVWEVDPNAGELLQFADTYEPMHGDMDTPNEDRILYETSEGQLCAFVPRLVATGGQEIAYPSLQRVTVCLSARTSTSEERCSSLYRDDFELATCAAGNGRLFGMDLCGHCQIVEVDPQVGSARLIGESLNGCYVTPTVLRNGRLIALPDELSNGGQVVLVDCHSLPLQQSHLQDALRKALFIGEHTDVTIKTQTGKTYRAHKLVLIMRSSVFKAMFATDMREARDAVVELGGDDASVTVSDMFMKYLYADGNELLPTTWTEVMSLAALAHRYEIEELATRCIELLGATLRVCNAIKLLRFSDRLQLAELKQATLDFIVAYDEVLDLDEWEEVSPSHVREVAAAMRGKRLKMRSPAEFEFHANTAWASLSAPQLRRACAERGLPFDGQRGELLERLTG